MQPESGHAHPHHSCVLVTAFLSQVSEAARELGLATAEEDRSEERRVGKEC